MPVRMHVGMATKLIRRVDKPCRFPVAELEVGTMDNLPMLYFGEVFNYLSNAEVYCVRPIDCYPVAGAMSGTFKS